MVERLDRVSARGTETVWRCSLRKDTPWTQAIFRLLPGWERRISATEEALWRIQPFIKPVNVVILVDRPWAYRIDKNTVYIGESLAEAGGHLERALVKAWMREQNPSFVNGDLVSEVTADLVYGVISGGLTLEDPAREVRTKMGARWPLAIKDAANYCASPWKLSEHFELCEKSPGELRDRAWRLGLRPLLASSILAAWWDLPIRERVEMYGNLSEWVAAGVNVGVDARREGLESAVRAVHAFQTTIVGKGSVSAAAASLSASLDATLRQSGFDESDARVGLDVLILSEMPLETGSTWFQQLAAFAKGRPELKIGVKDPAGLSLLPSRGRLRVDDVEDLKATRVAVLRCGRFDFNWVLSFEPMAQRLFVVDACGSKLPDMRAWVSGEAEGFAMANKGHRFIQFHLPSLAARKDSLDRTTDVLSVIQKRDVTDPVFRTLGWRELNWFKTVEAYHPRAQFDAIEWFRLN